MRYLPFALSFGSDLKQVIRSAAQDPRRRAVCGYCGGMVPIVPDLAEQRVRCPSCWHWQRISVAEETPWRLSPSAAVALRQTRRWQRG